jgi:hypothetical protein
LPDDAPLLIVSTDLLKALDRDLLAAGLAQVSRDDAGRWRIGKADERGRTFDLHAFRTTFNSLLAAAGVPLTARRILMRHAAEGITDEHYHDAKLIDVRGALDRLPGLPLDGRPEAQRLVATGSDGPASVYVPVYKTADNLSISRGIVDGMASHDAGGLPAANICADKPCESLAIPALQRAKGFEPSTSSLGKAIGIPSRSPKNPMYFNNLAT